MLNASLHDDVARVIGSMRRALSRTDIDRDYLRDCTEQLSTLTMAYGEVGLGPMFDAANFTPNEARILTLLNSRPGRTFSREAIMNAMYFDKRGDQPAIKIIDVYIFRIRRKLRDAKVPRAIECMWGMGYRLVDDTARS